MAQQARRPQLLAGLGELTVVLTVGSDTPDVLLLLLLAGLGPTGSVRRVGDSNYTRIRFRRKDRMRPKPPCWRSWVARKNYLALLRLDWARRLIAF